MSGSVSRSLRVLPIGALVLLIGAATAAMTAAQEKPVAPEKVQPPGQEAGPGTPPEVSNPIEALTDLTRSIKAKRQALEAKRAEVDATKNAQRKVELDRDVAKLAGEFRELELSFQTVATGIDVAAFTEGKKDSFDLRGELEGLLEPLVNELKDVTETPQQINNLKKEVAYYAERRQLVAAAIGNLERLRKQSADAELVTAIDKSLEVWRERASVLKSKWKVANVQLESREGERKSLIDSTQDVLARFFRTRGLNLILCVVAFIAVFFGLRLLYGGLRRMPLLRRATKRRTLWSRSASVLSQLFTVVAAFGAIMIVLYVREDWALLGLALLFLLGIAWASKQALPVFFEQIRLILNLGTVREYERIIYRGVPWRVSRLGFYTKLRNPSLTGGMIRLAAKELLTFHSRPHDEREGWFPSEEGDWLLLPDGGRGQVVLQTPEVVQLKAPGDSLITYPTADFLSLAPKNISHGFRLTVTFGIDYDHQPISTEEVPPKMTAHLREELKSVVDPEHIAGIRVEFAAAAASSLDYAVLADFRGEAARHVKILERAISRCLVDLCNRENWVIPFQQITLHTAETS